MKRNVFQKLRAYGRQMIIVAILAAVLVAVFAAQFFANSEKEKLSVIYTRPSSGEVQYALPAAAQAGDAFVVYVQDNDEAGTMRHIVYKSLQEGALTATIPLVQGCTEYFVATTTKTLHEINGFGLKEVKTTASGAILQGPSGALPLEKVQVQEDANAPTVEMVESYFADKDGNRLETNETSKMANTDNYVAIFTVKDDIDVGKEVQAYLFPSGTTYNHMLQANLEDGSLTLQGSVVGSHTYKAVFSILNISPMLPVLGGEANLFAMMQVRVNAQDIAGNPVSVDMPSTVVAGSTEDSASVPVPEEPEEEKPTLPKGPFSARIMSLQGPDVNSTLVKKGDVVTLKIFVSEALDLSKCLARLPGGLSTAVKGNYTWQETAKTDTGYEYTLTYTIKGTEDFKNGEVWFELNLQSLTTPSAMKMDIDYYKAEGIANLNYYNGDKSEYDAKTFSMTVADGVTYTQYARQGSELSVGVDFGSEGVAKTDMAPAWHKATYSLGGVSVQAKGMPVPVWESSVGGTGGSERFTRWTFTFVVPGGLRDNTLISFNMQLSLGGRSASVSGGGGESAPMWDLQAANSQVVYYAPIGSPEMVLTAVSAPDSSAKQAVRTKDGLIVTSGQILTISFTTGHPVSLSNVSVAGLSGYQIEVSSENGEGMVWTISCPINATNPNLVDCKNVPYSITIADRAGNESSVITSSNAKGEQSSAIYYAPIEIKNFSMISNNENAPTVAKVGDTITATIYTTHPVSVVYTTVGGQTAMGEIGSEKVEDKDGNELWKYTIKHVLKDNNLQDMSNVYFIVYVTDVAGSMATFSNGSLTSYPQEKQVMYFAPISMQSAEMRTNNLKDGQRYAKNGDAVQIMLDANHATKVDWAKVAGEKATAEQVDGVWSIQYTLQEGDAEDQAFVDFEVRMVDAAGNVLLVKGGNLGSAEAPVFGIVHKSGEVEETLLANQEDSFCKMANPVPIKYYAPIVAEASIFSNGKNVQYAKNGDTVSMTLTANHKVEIAQALIGGRSSESRADSDNKHTLSYQIPENESLMKEGNLSFAHLIVDAAGNELLVEKVTEEAVSRVIYDRTRPVVLLTPNFGGFTNKDIKCTITAEDVNIDISSVSVMLNQKEQVVAEERITSNNGRFISSVVFTEDGTYTLEAKAKDLAGNEALPTAKAKVTIDKKAPVVMRVDTSESTMRAYKDGTKLEDIVAIDEEYVSEVICTLTDAEGVNDWDLQEPFVTEGKKSALIVVQDMAGNSGELFFEFYIDATAPEPVVQDMLSQMRLLPDHEGKLFNVAAKLQVDLELLHVGDEEPDTLVFLELKDSSGKVIASLDTLQPNREGQLLLPLPKFGKYTLELEAVDSVGHSTGMVSYSFEYNDKNPLQQLMSNKPWFYTSIALVSLVGGAALVWTLTKKRKESRK